VACALLNDLPLGGWVVFSDRGREFARLLCPPFCSASSRKSHARTRAL